MVSFLSALSTSSIPVWLFTFIAWMSSAGEIRSSRPFMPFLSSSITRRLVWVSRLARMRASVMATSGAIPSIA